MNTTEQIIEEATGMNEYLRQTQPNDLTTLLNSLEKLESMLARANEMLAQAKLRKEETTQKLLPEIGKEMGLPASLANKFLSASVRLDSYAIDLVDGVCSTIRNTMDSRRTRISALKEEIRQLNQPDMYKDSSRGFYEKRNC